MKGTNFDSPNRLNELEAVAQLVNIICRKGIELVLTQQQLADKVGTVPCLETVYKIAHALGMSFKLH